MKRPILPPHVSATEVRLDRLLAAGTLRAKRDHARRHGVLGWLRRRLGKR